MKKINQKQKTATKSSDVIIKTDDVIKSAANVTKKQPVAETIKPAVDDVTNCKQTLVKEIPKKVMTSHKNNDVITKKGKNTKMNSKNVKKTSIWVGNPEIPIINIETRSDDVTAKQPEVMEVYSRFADITNINENLRDYVINKLGFETMTSVQARAFPHLINSKKDVLIRSPTGSGKTLTYALALLQNLQQISPQVTRHTGALALVLVPTRELAIQTFQIFRKLCDAVVRIVPTCLIGGQKRKSEKSRLRRGVNVIVTTPGRFLDHIENTTCLKLDQIKWLVLDEADRLLDAGFQANILKITSQLNKRVDDVIRTILLSATLTKGVEKLIELNLRDPIRVDVTTSTVSMPTVDSSTGLVVDQISFPSQLHQYVVMVPTKLRLLTLISFVKRHCIASSKHRVIIFLSCRDSVAFHHRLFVDVIKPLIKCNDVTVLPLHGGMDQNQRSGTITSFTNATGSALLLCTDVAARGLDLPQVDWVIQYTSPGNPVDYIHRVGRTARAGLKGSALLFLTPAEKDYVTILNGFKIEVEEMKSEEMMKSLVEDARTSNHLLRMQLGKERAAEIHRAMEERVKSDRKLLELSTSAFLSFVKSYATFPVSLKKIFHVKNLHLGHVAKSFVLQEAPTAMVSNLKRCLGETQIKTLKRNMIKMKKQSEEPIKKKRRHHLASKFDLSSEFSSGIKWK